MEPLTLESLPDDVLVKIGLSVAKLCGICDFFALSQASKRLHGILADSQETVDEIVRARIATIRRPIGSRTSHTLANCKVQTLQQLDLCERLAHHELLEENRILIGSTHFMPTFDQILTLSRTVNAIIDILPRHPSLRVALHSHVGLYDISPSRKHADFVEGEIVARIARRHTFQGNHELCFVIHHWGTRISEKATVGSRWGWIQVIFEMDNKKDGSAAGSGTGRSKATATSTSNTNEPGQKEIFELPPRPDIYNDNENQDIGPDSTVIKKYTFGTFGGEKVSFERLR